VAHACVCVYVCRFCGEAGYQLHLPSPYPKAWKNANMGNIAAFFMAFSLEGFACLCEDLFFHSLLYLGPGGLSCNFYFGARGRRVEGRCRLVVVIRCVVR
jgi:hypothetical protein